VIFFLKQRDLLSKTKESFFKNSLLFFKHYKAIICLSIRFFTRHMSNNILKIKSMKQFNYYLILFFILGSLQLNAQNIALDVPYVPTPQKVVVGMLELADVKKGEVVYDLGCGDGRIVITAAKEYGATGIGVDLNPVRIEEANTNAEEAKVKDKVTFHVDDLFNFDFSKADVLALYLLPDVNMKLRPKIQSEMKPGSRIVSHAFDMGDWEPNKKISVDGKTIYLWIIPDKK
jgi:SAM-dependent methyltransferase